MKSIFTTVLVSSGLALTMASSAFAGELLRLNAGTFRVQDASAQITKNAGSAIGTHSIEGKKYFIVQFQNKVSEAGKAALAAQGLEPKTYIPDDAVLVRGSASQAGRVNLIPGVRAVVPFAPEWKVSQDLLLAGADNEAKLLHISVADITDTAAVAQKLRGTSGVVVRHASDRDIMIEASRALVPSIATIEGIAWIQEAPVFVPMHFPMDEGDDDGGDEEIPPPPPAEERPPALTGYESGTKIMKFDAAWDRGYHGEGQTVGMGDTGVDMGDLANMHADLVAVTKGYPMGFGSSSWEDTNGHGTHVCGSVVGNGAKSNGAIQGGASAAKMVVDGLWSPIMDNLMFPTDFNKLINKPYADGVRIHTNSWGRGGKGEYDAFAAKADEYMWKNPDLLLLFAAGNDGADLNADGRIDERSIGSPATAKNLLTVGASENLLAEGGIQKNLGELRDGDKKWGVEPLKSDKISNSENGLACFSSRGPTADGRIKPDIVAPGTNIVSTLSRHPEAGKLWGAYGKDYAYAGGTSMATPLTAGAAVVTRQYLVEDKEIANPSAALVKATLIHTAYDMYPGQYGTGDGQELPTPRPNVHEGFGRVDVARATKLDATQIVDNQTGVGLDEEITGTVKIRRGKANLRATLVYTDAPGSPTAAKALVNDLDLKVITPDGEVKELNDHTNNVEMLELRDLAPGEYKVVVKGVNVPQGKEGKQPYALLVTLQ